MAELDEKKDPALDEVFTELEQVIAGMETEESLEKSFQLYHRGMDLLKLCNDKIDTVEKNMLILDEKGDAHEFQ